MHRMAGWPVREGALRRRRRECPFNRAAAPCRSLPTRLADGLGLESTPVRLADLRPRAAPDGSPRWFPRSRAGRGGIRHTLMGIVYPSARLFVAASLSFF